ncbi:MAG: D-alanine--D-alanine ligase [Clostridia bacterium]|nr:D-alanine--D-alanine ligase [Clostridia bacterium]MBR5367370.1 D-alanine--D-alanine ligase [Clostridia bacterium]
MNTILLLFGGKSSEYEVSLSSATGAYQNIDRRKYNVLLCGITKKDGRFWLYEDDPAKIADGTWADGRKVPLSVDLSDGSLSVDRDGVIEHLRPDAVLPMIHGKYCEDGTLQGLFAVAGIPVVGCDCQSSAVCMDKAVTKAIVAIETGLKTARGIVVKAENAGTPAEIDAVRRAAEEAFGYPMFVKPARAGSSVGVNKVKKPEDFARALALAFAEDTKILVEEAVNGREIEVAVLEEHGRYTVAHPAEIDCGSSEFYDYETKYISDASSFYLPARISPEKQEEVRGHAEAIFRALDCRGLARVDFFCTRDGEEFVFNEINTLPGFTPISMYPKMMVNEGIAYGELLDRLIQTAIGGEN